jgi:hypothetical protein
MCQKPEVKPFVMVLNLVLLANVMSSLCGTRRHGAGGGMPLDTKVIALLQAAEKLKAPVSKKYLLRT